MNRLTLILLFVLLSFYSVFPQSPSLIGPQGLILTPTARFPVDGQIRMGYSNIRKPYAFIKWGDKTTQNHLVYTTLVFLPRLDLTGVITQAPGAEGNAGTGTYKDLALFAHIQLLEESKRFPSIMLGIHDFYSYSYYNALFLSSSKSYKLNPVVQINTHLGYGVDWMDQHYGPVAEDQDSHVIHHLMDLDYRQYQILPPLIFQYPYLQLGLIPIL